MQLDMTGVERYFNEDDIIVSKTDSRGIMTYVNDIFLDISGYTEQEMVGKPHSVIRHGQMPKCVFRLLWEHIKAGQELFAYVVNRCKNGDHYWVLAHVTPTLGAQNEVIGYHSSRRVPRRDALRAIEPVYKHLLSIEAQHGLRAGVDASSQALKDMLKEKGVSYDKFILAI